MRLRDEGLCMRRVGEPSAVLLLMGGTYLGVKLSHTVSIGDLGAVTLGPFRLLAPV